MLRRVSKFLNENGQSKKSLLTYSILVVIPLLTLLIIETIHRGSISKALSWISESTFSFTISYVFLLLIALTLFILPRKIFFPLFTLITLLATITAFGSYKKFQLRGDYLTPNDLYLIKEGTDILNVIQSLLTFKTVALLTLFLLSLLAFIVLLIRSTHFHSFRIRLVVSIFASILLGLIIVNPALFEKKSNPQGSIERYETLGLVGGFLTLNEKNKAAKIEEYEEVEIDQILMNLEKSEDKSEVSSEFNPNVIVVLAEAFWDPLKLDLEFKGDPIPFYRSLEEQSTSGELITHVFGGGTINTELEIMTGLTTRFLPEGSETYNHYITRPIDSLAHVYRSQGYHTEAVHTFKNWFYNRNQTYKYLGYEKFISMEYFSNADYIGPYIDDRELMKKTIEEMKTTKGPDFVNTVTVSSHGPYDDIRYEHLPSCTKGDQLTKVPQYILDLYCQVLSETDDALKILIEGVKELEEPTMVVIYGDHLPMLGYDYAVYREADYINGTTSYEEYMKLHTAPLLVWDNFPKEHKLDKETLRMTPNFLGAYILDRTKKEKSPIFQQNWNLYRDGVTIIPRSSYNKEEKLDTTKLEDYKLLQHDILFGKQYSYKEQPVLPAENYHLGSDIMKVKKITINSTDTSYILTLKGAGFVSNASIYINNQKVKTTFINDSELKTSLSKDDYKKGEKIPIKVKLMDDQETVLAETNEKNIVLK
jgi:phosphoglycerol transferase MdoB-like AlkP superfamily enzyme